MNDVTKIDVVSLGQSLLNQIDGTTCKLANKYVFSALKLPHFLCFRKFFYYLSAANCYSTLYQDRILPDRK